MSLLNYGMLDVSILTDAWLTLDVFRVVDDEVSVPDDGEIHGQLTDFHPLVQILQQGMRMREGRQTDREGGGVSEPIQTCPLPRSSSAAAAMHA